MKNSSLGKLSFKDFVKGLITAVLTGVLTGIYTSVNSGALPTATDLKVIGTTSILAGGGYILKNLGTNDNDEFLKKDSK